MTGMKLFEVVFQGRLVDGADPGTVKKNIASLFNTDAANLEKLFSGKRFVIKGNLDEQTAQKYRLAMEKAGAVCQILEKDPKAGTITAGMTAVSIADPGIILDESAPALAPNIDISSLNILSVGVDMQDAPIEVKQDAIPEAIEASIAPLGENLIQPQVVAAPAYHFEGLSMAEPGTDLDEGVEDVPAALPDISLLELAPADSVDQVDNSESSYLKSLGLAPE